MAKFIQPILYSYYRSSASFRVRIALAHKGIDYEYRPISLVKDGGQQLSESYRELNPMAQVPSLVIGDVTLTQSLPIIEYLEETRPEKPLLPKDPILRAQARAIAEIVNSGIQPIQNLTVQKMVVDLTNDDSKMAYWTKHWILGGLKAIETTLAKTAGRFCVGNEVTVADLCLVPQMYNALRFGVDVTPFPIINRIVGECDQLEAFQKAHPSQQPDAPKEGAK